MATLELININKVYPNGVQAVFDFNLKVADKEFIVFVGPSGCGKSTTLRMIAGLEEISSGEFYIDGELMNDVAPKDRNIAMVFQSYALYPHMTVYNNMAFGLQLRRVPKEEINRKVVEAAKRHNIMIEINNSSLSGSSRPGSGENCKEITKLCKEIGAKVIMSSDAHICYSIGDFKKPMELLNEIGMPKDLIMNDPVKLISHLKSKGSLLDVNIEDIR